MRGVILAGGTGSRLFPLSLIFNKHLLPIYNHFMIDFPLMTLKDMGITNVCVVLGNENVSDFIRLLQDGSQLGMVFSYVYQRKAGGIAQAIGLCEDFVHGEDFIVILGDNLFLGGNLVEFKTNFAISRAACGLLFAEVEHPENYGVPRFDSNEELVEIIEKPTPPAFQLCRNWSLRFYSRNIRGH